MNKQEGNAEHSAARVADLLRSARAGRRQTDMARAIQVTQSGYSAWERGERTPKVTYWHRIEQTLGLKPGAVSRAIYGTSISEPSTAVAIPYSDNQELLSAIGELTAPTSHEVQVSTNEVGKLLRRARGGRRQQDIADLIGVKQTAYSAWERGTRVPRAKYWASIEEVLGIDHGTIQFCIHGEAPLTPQADRITSENSEIIAAIGELTDENRELVKTMLRTMLAQQRGNR